MIKEENTMISVIIPKVLKEKLIKEAEYEDRSLSNLVAKILREHCEIKNEE